MKQPGKAATAVNPVTGLLAILLLLTACEREPSANVYVEGELIWTDDQQTLINCDTGDTYWAHIVASNPNFYMFYRVAELKAKSPESVILAKVEGTVKPLPSARPDYPADAALYINRVHAIEPGSCDQAQTD